MNRRLLAPLALVAALSLTACMGGPTVPSSPDSVLPDAGGSGSGAPQIMGGSATVTFDGVTYEFFSDDRFTCTQALDVLLADLALESSNGESVESSGGWLDIELATPGADERVQADSSVALSIPGHGLYAAGGSNNDLEVTLVAGDYAAHGEQVLEDVAGLLPPITAQIDVACNVLE